MSWDASGPQAGYFPFYLALILGAASVYRPRERLHAKPASEPFVTREQLTPRPADVRADLLFVVVTQWLGLYVASFVLIAGFMTLVGRIALWKSLLTAAIFTRGHVHHV